MNKISGIGHAEVNARSHAIAFEQQIAVMVIVQVQQFLEHMDF
jgi:hypothetical protein